MLLSAVSDSACLLRLTGRLSSKLTPTPTGLAQSHPPAPWAYGTLFPERRQIPNIISIHLFDYKRVINTLVVGGINCRISLTFLGYSCNRVYEKVYNRVGKEIYETSYWVNWLKQSDNYGIGDCIPIEEAVIPAAGPIRCLCGFKADGLQDLELHLGECQLAKQVNQRE